MIFVEFACRLRSFFFFFQAEDGIRDIGVTGVQTCALPIYDLRAFEEPVMARAGNDDELTLWDRIGDRGRRRNRNGVIFAVDDKGWARDAAELHGQCVRAEVGE